MNKVYLWLLLAAVFSPNANASIKCQSEWQSLKHTQQLMRHKSTETLRQKEHKKAKAYQDCRRGKTKPKIEINKKNLTTNSTHKQRQNTASKSKINKSEPIKYTRSINVSGKFSGEKQDAWLKHYQAPKECAHPKTTQQFAKCTENRNEQATKFSVAWEKTRPR
ncbi:hypothetical protein [Thalassotalea ganghwensis]